MSPTAYDRVILRPGGLCPHLFHRLKPIRRAAGCTYEVCPDCLTRRIVIEPGGEPDTQWLRSGYFTAAEEATMQLPMEEAA